MDLGPVLAMDGLEGFTPEPGGLHSSLPPPDTEASSQRTFGSIKHDRPAEPEDCNWRSLKVARSEALVTAPAKAAPSVLRSNSQPLLPDGVRMLSFSSTSKTSGLVVANRPSAPSSTQCYLRKEGLFSGSSNVNMQGVLARFRAPYTPSQWLELEHQALIYKYLVANAPVPSTLLIPIRRSLSASGISPLTAGSFGSVGLGYIGNADPEPGRCRRTDGKKWRCTRDAVADQKYCERHMNRGRHRSRKHVEGQIGHAFPKQHPSLNLPNQLLLLMVVLLHLLNTLAIAQQQNRNMQSNATIPCGMLMSNEEPNVFSQKPQSLFMPSPVNQKPDTSLLQLPKQHNPFEESPSGADIGLISPDSLFNPLRNSFADNINFLSPPKPNDQQVQSNPLKQFIDDHQLNSCGTAVIWDEVEETQPDTTHLSVSIRMAGSDLSYSTSSYQYNQALSPIKLSTEYDPAYMGLGVGLLKEVYERQTTGKPVLREYSMSGPLGEVLTSINSTSKDQSENCSSSLLNLMADDWDSSFPLAPMPMGVLQKTSFGSLSSSTGRSPRVDASKLHDSTSSICNRHLGPTSVNASAVSDLFDRFTMRRPGRT